MNPLRLLPLLLLAVFCLRAEPAPALTAAAPAAVAGLERAGLLQQLANDLAAHFSIIETLDVELVRPWSPPAAADASTAMVVEVTEYPEALASSMLVRVRYTQADRVLREDVLALRVSLWRESMVAATPQRRGEPVSMHSVTIRRVDALRDREALPVSAVSEDYVFAREIPAGRMLVWRDVVRRPLVRRGQMVEVQAGAGQLVITMKALAMEDGARGESVRVRNIESKRDFVALVTAENRAEVRL